MPYAWQASLSIFGQGMRSGFNEQSSLSRISSSSINMMHAVASYLWRDIEVVITGLTRNQFVRKHTRVRIRRSEIDKLACQSQSVRIFAESEYPSLIKKHKQGFERWPKIFAKRYIKSNPKRWAKIKNESLSPKREEQAPPLPPQAARRKNSRVGEYPSLLYSKKRLRFLLFCGIIISSINKNLQEAMYAWKNEWFLWSTTWRIWLAYDDQHWIRKRVLSLYSKTIADFRKLPNTWFGMWYGIGTARILCV